MFIWRGVVSSVVCCNLCCAVSHVAVTHHMVGAVLQHVVGLRCGAVCAELRGNVDIFQARHAKVPCYKGALQECHARMSHQVLQSDCFAKVYCKRFLQKCFSNLYKNFEMYFAFRFVVVFDLFADAASTGPVEKNNFGCFSELILL